MPLVVGGQVLALLGDADDVLKVLTGFANNAGVGIIAKSTEGKEPFAFPEVSSTRTTATPSSFEWEASFDCCRSQQSTCDSGQGSACQFFRLDEEQASEEAEGGPEEAMENAGQGHVPLLRSHGPSKRGLRVPQLHMPSLQQGWPHRESVLEGDETAGEGARQVDEPSKDEPSCTNQASCPSEARRGAAGCPPRAAGGTGVFSRPVLLFSQPDTTSYEAQGQPTGADEAALGVVDESADRGGRMQTEGLGKKGEKGDEAREGAGTQGEEGHERKEGKEGDEDQAEDPFDVSISTAKEEPFDISAIQEEQSSCGVHSCSGLTESAGSGPEDDARLFPAGSCEGVRTHDDAGGPASYAGKEGAPIGAGSGYGFGGKPNKSGKKRIQKKDAKASGGRGKSTWIVDDMRKKFGNSPRPPETSPSDFDHRSESKFHLPRPPEGSYNDGGAKVIAMGGNGEALSTGSLGLPATSLLHLEQMIESAALGPEESALLGKYCATLRTIGFGPG